MDIILDYAIRPTILSNKSKFKNIIYTNIINQLIHPIDFYLRSISYISDEIVKQYFIFVTQKRYQI